MFGVSMAIFCTVSSSTRDERSFFSVAITTPLVALMPKDVAPELTALRAYSIWTSLPLGLNVVREKEYCKEASYTSGVASESLLTGYAQIADLGLSHQASSKVLLCSQLTIEAALQIEP